VLSPYGVASPEYPVVRLPAVADLSSYLLLDTGERGFTNVTDSRGLVFYAEEHGVLALDILLLYSLGFCPVPALFLEFEPGHRGAVDLVGAVGEAQGAGARPQVCEREVVRDACAPVGLYSPV
jgi:hypothetical protein